MKALFANVMLVLFCFSLSARAEEGVTDTEIKLGGHSVLSGPFAFYGQNMTLVTKAYFEEINSKGGIFGRKINFIVADNEFNPQKTIEAVKKLIQKDKVFALVGNQGVTHVAAYKIPREMKVPDLFILDSSADYTVPVNHWSFALPTSFPDEGELLANYIVSKFPGKKIGFLTPKTQAGESMVAAAKKVLKGKLEFGPEEIVSFNAPDANSQIINLMNAKVDVVLVLSAPPITPNAIKFAAEKGFKPNWILNAFNCNDSTVNIGGAAVEGAVSDGYQKLDWDDPAVVEHVRFMKKAMPNLKPSAMTLVGQVMGEITVETLKRAGKNLTREGVIEAAESLDNWTCSVCAVATKLSKTEHRVIRKPVLRVIKDGKWVTIQ
jgi:branched-chain amino acid transport system substrate-binding protein